MSYLARAVLYPRELQSSVRMTATDRGPPRLEGRDDSLSGAANSASARPVLENKGDGPAPATGLCGLCVTGEWNSRSRDLCGPPALHPLGPSVGFRPTHNL